MSITATHRREFSSPNQTVDAPECPAKWLVLHRAATVKHRKNNRLHVTAQDVGKRTNPSHGKHSLNAMCNHVEQPWTPTATPQPTRDSAQNTTNTHRTHGRSRMRTHTRATRHAKPNLKTKCGHTTKHATHGTPWNQNDVDITSSPRRFSKLDP